MILQPLALAIRKAGRLVSRKPFKSVWKSDHRELCSPTDKIAEFVPGRPQVFFVSLNKAPGYFSRLAEAGIDRQGHTVPEHHLSRNFTTAANHPTRRYRAARNLGFLQNLIVMRKCN